MPFVVWRQKIAAVSVYTDTMDATSYSDEFNRLVGFLGGPIGDQIDVLGQPDDRDGNYVWFESVNASFCWDEGRVVRLYAPTKDAFCRPLDEPTNAYVLSGLRPGMTKAEVLEAWGRPTSGADIPTAMLWNYRDKRIVTRSGEQAYLDLSFETEADDPDQHTLRYFGAALVEPASRVETRSGARASAAGDEALLFERDGILVTDRRVVVSGATLPIRAIASVDVGKLPQSHKGPMVFYGLSPLPLCAGNWLLALALAAIGAAWQFVQIQNPTYVLTIRTMDGGGKELSGSDGVLFAEVATAINEAVANS